MHLMASQTHAAQLEEDLNAVKHKLATKKAAHVIEVAELKEARASRIAELKEEAKSKVAAVRQRCSGHFKEAAAEVTRLKGRNLFLEQVCP